MLTDVSPVTLCSKYVQLVPLTEIVLPCMGYPLLLPVMLEKTAALVVQ
jgi:hypothetical protein